MPKHVALAEEGREAPKCVTCSDEKVHASYNGFRGEAALIVQGHVIRPHVAAKRCDGCEWQMASVCRNPQDKRVDSDCGAARRDCPVGEFRMDVMFRSEAQPVWRQVGSTCLGGPNDIVTPAQLDAAVRDTFKRLVPTQDVGLQPVQVALINIPVLFRAGQPRGVTLQARPLGVRIRISATPVFTWYFGDGSTLSTRSPGGEYPDKSVGHTYRRPGTVNATLTTTWRGTYTVGDDPEERDIPGAVTQASGSAADLRVRLVETRAELVADPG